MLERRTESAVATNDIRLRWVLPDPATERAVDPLGMGMQADRIADLLLPQISVATTRARYFSFLCWAVRRANGSTSMIHRLEAELAIEEATRHKGDEPGTCPGVVGRSSAARFLETNGKPPSRPERLYKNTALATYRPTMRALGIMTLGRGNELTIDGDRLASAFEQARGRRPRCLSDVGSSERSQIRKLLGLDYRKSLDSSSPAMRRRATFDALRQLLDDEADSATVLENHANLGLRRSEVAMAMHRAFVWELLSCGLSLTFSMLLHKQNTAEVARALRQELGGRPRRPPLRRFMANDPETGRHVIGFLRAAANLDSSHLNLDSEPFDLAARLIEERDPSGFVQQLVERHRKVKRESPWLTLSGSKVRVLAPQKCLAFDVRPRTYRLDAFKQLLRDLGMIR